MSGSKTQRARLESLRSICLAQGHALSHRDTRAFLRHLKGLELDHQVVAREIDRRRTLRDAGACSGSALNAFNVLARSEFRIVGSCWQARVHVNVARTGLRFWLNVDEVRPDDVQLLCAERPSTPEMRGMAQRLRSAARLASERIRRRCVELDTDAILSASDEDLIYVKTAMRQLEMPSAIPREIVASIESAHANALAKSMAISRISSNPHDIGRIMRLVDASPRRRILALVGPTNSGKTHEGLTMLAAARSGSYLGPLRLMAMEQYDRLKAHGVAVSLRTGEECLEHPEGTHLSATVEMADASRHQQVVVVDETQLLSDPRRGWAWTRAIFHSRCDTLVVTGSKDCLPILRRIASITGEIVEVREFERRAPLVTMPTPIELGELRSGDAVIAFSRTNVLAMKAEISRITNPSTGHPYKVATIYGALGPEVRRTEARRFSTGEAEIMIATDAIGMGLNLPIDRVIFSSLTKYDGRVVRGLEDSEIRQIGGRAGRMGQSQGQVGVLSGADVSTTAVRRALSRQPEDDSDARPYIWPTYDQIEAGMEALEIGTLSRALPAVSALLRSGPEYRCQIDPDTIDLLQTIEQSELPVEEVHAWIGCPLPLKDAMNRAVALEWTQRQAKRSSIPAPFLTSVKAAEIDDHRLKDVERIVVQAGAYLWLSRRWPMVYDDAPAALETRNAGNRMIEEALRQRHIPRNCVECETPIGYRVRQDTCRRCALS